MEQHPAEKVDDDPGAELDPVGDLRYFQFRVYIGFNTNQFSFPLECVNKVLLIAISHIILLMLQKYILIKHLKIYPKTKLLC